MNARELGSMPAYPVPLPKGEWEPEEAFQILERSRGLTKREAFAMAAMQAEVSTGTWHSDERWVVAKRCTEFADALLEALAKDQP